MIDLIEKNNNCDKLNISVIFELNDKKIKFTSTSIDLVNKIHSLLYPFVELSYDTFTYSKEIICLNQESYTTISNPELVSLYLYEDGYKYVEGINVIYTNLHNIKLFEVTEKKIYIYLSNDIVESARQCFRVIREALYNELFRCGAIRLHCSVFSFDSKGFLFIGNKGSGKTTCLLNAMKIEKSKFCANDRAVISKFSNKLMANGLPICAKISNEQVITYLNSDNLEDGKLYYDNMLNNSSNKRNFTPQELAVYSNRNIVPQINVNLICIPNIRGSNKNEKCKLTLINDCNYKKKILKENILSPDLAFPFIFFNQFSSETIFEDLLELPWYTLTSSYDSIYLKTRIHSLINGVNYA